MLKYVCYVPLYVPVYREAHISAAPVVCNRVGTYTHTHADMHICGLKLFTDTQAVENRA